MNLLLKVCIFSGCFLFLTACSSIKQNIEPIPQQDKASICIIENASVKEGFLNTFENVLQERGYVVKIIQPGGNTEGCGLTSTYTGIWKWDLAIYLAYARIDVFSNGQRVGLAEYDTGFGGLNLNKFVKGHVKVRELVEKLFPKRISEKTPSDLEPSKATDQAP